MYFILLAVMKLLTNGILANGIRVNIDKHCRDKDRLITSEENDEYMLVNAESNATIVLACRYCDEREEPRSKIWHYQDRFREKAEKEVELGMDSNVSYSKIYTTLDLSLVIRNFLLTDAGIYRCHGTEGQGEADKYNYRIEPVLKDTGDEYLEEGNITEWERYRETYLWPVTTRFAVSKMTDLAEVREEGVTLQVISEWGPWSLCKQCVDNRGIKTSRGHCRLKRNINSILIILMCPPRSTLLQDEFPSISRVVRYLPEFLLKEPCKKCPTVKKIKKDEKFRYAKRYVLAEGAHLAVVCPESSTASQVVWRKDSLILKKGTGRSFRKLDEEARVIVDTFSTLYLIDVSAKEQGNYTCYVDNVNMMRVKIIVTSKPRLLTQAFFRHLVYLGFIFFLTSFCYCAGIIITCRQRDKFRTLSHNDPSEEEVE